MDNNYNPQNENNNNENLDVNLDIENDQINFENIDITPLENEEKPKKPIWLVLALPLGAIAIIIVVLILAFGGDDENSSDEADKKSTSQTESTSTSTTINSTTSPTAETSTTIHTTAQTTAQTTVQTTVATTEKPKEEIKKETKKETIFYETKYEYDNTLEEGKEKTKQEGKNGYKSYEREVTYLNGQVTKTGEWKLIETVKSTNRVVVVGTKEKELSSVVEWSAEGKEQKNITPAIENDINGILSLVNADTYEYIKNDTKKDVKSQLDGYLEMLFMYSMVVDHGRPFGTGKEYTYFNVFPLDYQQKWINKVEEYEGVLREVYKNFDNEVQRYMDERFPSYDLDYYSFIGRSEEFAKANGLDAKTLVRN